MEERKTKEIEHYDVQAEHQADTEQEFVPVLASQRFLYKIAVPLVSGKKVLDYGCGDGIHIPFLSEHAAEVVGIDLSEASLELARRKYKILDTKYPSTPLLSTRVEALESRTGKIQFLKMDCEALEFEPQSFDVVFDGGTFSSLDYPKAIGEITRVLKPNGALIGIETFGHNPFANAKRVLNKFTGKRTAWAASHIVTKKEIDLLERNFEQVEVHYFHLVSLFAFPFLNLPGGIFVLQLAQQMDNIVFGIPFFRTYAFKVVFVCKDVKKNI